MKDLKYKVSDLSFYKNLYVNEMERSYYYDKIIQFPSYLLFILVGGAVYSFDTYFKNGIPETLELIDWTFLILNLLFALALILTILFLFKVFHVFTRKYDYLPYISQLREREEELLEFVVKSKTKPNMSEKDIINETKNLFQEDLLFYYIELTNTNQLVNDSRAKNYAITRNLLFFDLILFFIIGIIGLIFKTF